MVVELHWKTPPEWAAIALAGFDAFLQDHAANERKVSHSALMLAVYYPDRTQLVDPLVELAREEFEHFVAVYELLKERGLPLGQDLPDPYMGSIFRRLRKGVGEEALLDRLVVFAIVEARGFERFQMVADALAPGRMRDFYQTLAASESRHRATYVRLARGEFGDARVAARLDELLTAEAEIISSLELRPALH